jgi:DNA-directed RNA polymerase specialized sigma24 family protein
VNVRPLFPALLPRPALAPARAANDLAPPPEGSDEALVAAIARGDGRALATLRERYRKNLLSIARSALDRDRAGDAVDVVQDVMLALLDGGAARYRPGRGKVKTYLGGLVRAAARAYDEVTLVSWEEEAEKAYDEDDRLAEEERGCPVAAPEMERKTL